ncbi:alpha-rhamnosidase [Lacihabitans sp. CCS-44]|uniref:alpha-L-rhamnosidase-related protein n=1 Tax=Lacihabitans sp. CCS-44 TaxID=2487331 RepID=UPI0020CE6B53|nr:alpha-L-rhamnosidase N-terminal domain-containing protein [Lacihabitans sp. CCS-44]MCP9755523.1 alpha-rhamnosidase [Lacihabitans sp. CCS-44]
MRNNVCVIGILIALFLVKSNVFSQEIPAEYIQKIWPAKWISVPKTNPTAYGVYLFRKQFELKESPKNFRVFISADNKYKLFVNNKLVGIGPAKGDIGHWNYDIIDLAPFLAQGKNTIAVKVWNEAEARPEFQFSVKTALVIQGSNPETQVINTNNSWKCVQDNSYEPLLVSEFMPDPAKVNVRGYYVAGPGEKIDMSQHIKGWEDVNFDDGDWKNAQIVAPAMSQNTIGLDAGNSWRLIPSILPQMELTQQRFEKLRKAEGITISNNFPKEGNTISIPANTIATLILDQTFLTNAYPTVLFSGGKDAKLSLTYAEAFYTKDKSGSEEKGNRDEIEGKFMVGRKDIILSNGSQNQSFTTLAYRTFRYVEVKIETKDTALNLEDIFSTFTGYPFQQKAKLNTDKVEINQILNLGWRTARLCAMDTYMDCPYYEQLQYIGDTRIQAMVTLYNTGDDRLVKNALNLMDNSRKPEGITASRYPSVNQQIIPTFSLWYIGMLHDYMMYGSDSTFVQNKLQGTRQIINYFEGFRDKEGSLKNLPNWFFVDWVKKWNRGMPPIGKDGSSALLDLQLLLAYKYAADLEKHKGMMAFSNLYEKQAKAFSAIIRKKYWDDSKKLFADTPEKNIFSQHTNALAILAGVVSGVETQALGKLLLSDKTLTEGSIYFKYYIHQALTKAGLGSDYSNWLSIWHKNIELGMTTLGEDSEVEETRSDCHAWGASPNIEFFRVVLGIESASPNFKTVKIEPHLGGNRKISGEMPHPQGMISVAYDLDKSEANINLPKNVSGSFVWKNKGYKLKGGGNAIRLN